MNTEEKFKLNAGEIIFRTKFLFTQVNEVKKVKGYMRVDRKLLNQLKKRIFI